MWRPGLLLFLQEQEKRCQLCRNQVLKVHSSLVRLLFIKHLRCTWAALPILPRAEKHDSLLLSNQGTGKSSMVNPPAQVPLALF